jgi:hypothetical protein
MRKYFHDIVIAMESISGKQAEIDPHGIGHHLWCGFGDQHAGHRKRGAAGNP